MPLSLRQPGIMLIQDTEAIRIARLPGLCPAAEVEDSRVRYHPVRVRFSGAAQQVTVVVAGVIVPDSIVQRQNSISIHGVEDILIRQKQARLMLCGKSENLPRINLFPAGI